MKPKRVIGVLSIGVTLGCLIGSVAWFSYIMQNRYIHYEMYKLVVFALQQYLNRWIILILLILLTFSIMILSLLLMQKLIWKWCFSHPIEDKSKVMQIITIILLCSLLFLFGGWAINHYCLTNYTKFQFISLLVDAIALLLTIFLGWILIKVNLGRIFAIIESKYVNATAVILIIFLAILNLGVVFDNQTNPPEGPNIIILLIDALRKDHVGVYGYDRQTTPNIDRFAREGIVFQNAVSQCSWTSPSIASLFSGFYPSVHGVISYGDRGGEVEASFLDHRIVTLAEVLRDKGYATGAFVANHWLCERLQFDQGFDIFDPINSEYKPLASEVNKKAVEWIRKVKNRAFFVYLHYMDVHGPYEPPKPFDSFFKCKENIELSDDDVAKIPGHNTSIRNLNYYIDQYDGEIRYTDRHIGHFLNVLNEYNLLSNSIIIITADHGEAFLEHGFGDHGWSLYAEEINIPLIVKLPESIKWPNINERFVQLIDVTATLLPLVNCCFPYKANGLNLATNTHFDILGGEGAFSEELAKKMKGPPKRAMIKDNFKAVYMVDDETVTELYDLGKDKREKENLVNLRPNISLEFAKKIEKWHNKRLHERSKLGLLESSVIIRDREQLEQLKSLGYVQ